jgi:hypothetical protein
VLDIAGHDYVLSTSREAKMEGCIYRLSEIRGLSGHSTASFFENVPSNQEKEGVFPDWYVLLALFYVDE